MQECAPVVKQSMVEAVAAADREFHRLTDIRSLAVMSHLIAGALANFAEAVIQSASCGFSVRTTQLLFLAMSRSGSQLLFL
jgi:hypothetical protein